MTVDSARKVGSRRKPTPKGATPVTESGSALDRLGRTPGAESRAQMGQTDETPVRRERRPHNNSESETLRGAERVWTVPNILSFSRILMVPVFLWLVLGLQRDGLAIAVLVISGITDYLDGKIARSTGQITHLGALLDPIADRLFILAVVVALAMRDVIPWWLALSLPLRDVLLIALVPFLRTRGFSSLPVHFLGKAATAVLLYAFPLLLLGDGIGSLANLARVFGWAFSIWGVGLYWWAGALYVVQVRQLLRDRPKQAHR